ncbi:energy-coupling factor ABC transporter ATP-binding protein [Marinactinospora thermotolerans]|uniref:energy-coupling factor ABC transporter ATP-binding protein n=1 Tax=Marinactinospora thermotolerans TaxID=531310 RepID=UPI003D8C2869
MSDANARIRLSEVTVERDGKTVLKDIDLSLDEHRIAVIGLNGSGKSTLVRLLNALVLPTRGTVTVDGYPTDKHAKKVRRKVGFVFQNPENQIVMPVVSEDIAFGLKNLGLGRAETAVAVEKALAELELSHLADRESYALSGGEKQMVALASVLVMEPETIIFDEPSTMLDLRNKRRLQQRIDALTQRAIVVTHDLDLIAGYDRAIVLHEGALVFDGDPPSAISFYEDLCR